MCEIYTLKDVIDKIAGNILTSIDDTIDKKTIVESIADGLSITIVLLLKANKAIPIILAEVYNKLNKKLSDSARSHIAMAAVEIIVGEDINDVIPDNYQLMPTDVIFHGITDHIINRNDTKNNIINNINNNIKNNINNNTKNNIKNNNIKNNTNNNIKNNTNNIKNNINNKNNTKGNIKNNLIKVRRARGYHN